MKDVLRYGKKLFTVSVASLTIAWSMGLAALVPAGVSAEVCPSLSAGSLMKTPNASAVYLLSSTLKRLDFPNAEVYKTWYNDYSGVVTVPASCGEGYAYGGSVTYRPGSRMIKVQAFPTVFAILPGNKKAKIANETVATELYGANWAKLVRDLPDYWMDDYAAGSDLTEAAPHNGQLVKKSGSADVYYVWDGKLSKVEGSLSVAASGDVRTVSEATFGKLSMGSTVTSMTVVTDPSQGGGTTPATPPAAAGSVSVGLAASNPAATTIIAEGTPSEYSQGHIPFTSLAFTASANEDANVTMVRFTRTGIANDADLGNLYLYDGETKVAEYTSFNDKVVTFSNSTGLFTVSKGTTKTVTLRGDLARGAVSSGKTIGFSVNSSSDVTAVGSVSGSFPMTGNLMNTTQVTDLGHISLTSYTSYPSTVKADEANKELWRFTATADAQDMELRRVVLTMIGTISPSDIQNLRLEVGGVQVGSAASIGNDKMVTFDLSASPIKINAGQPKIVVLRGDLKGGSGRVFKFSIQRITDLVSFDTDYGVYVPTTITSPTTAFAVVQPTTGNGTTIDSGTLTLGVATDSPTGNIADAGTSLTLAKFSFGAAGEAVKVDNLGVSCTGSDITAVLRNVKVLLDGSQVGSTVSTMTCSYSTSTYSFGNTFVVPAGTTKSLTVVADTTGDNLDANDTVVVNLAVGSSNATGQTTLTALSTTAQTARTLTVKTGTASVVSNSSFGNKSASNPTGTVNAANVKIASFIITAGAGEAIDVTQIGLADEATYQLGDNFQKLKLMNGSTQIGTTIDSLNSTAGTYTFTPSTAIRVTAGQQYVVDVYADIKSSVTNSATLLTPVVVFDSVTATGVNTSADASYTTDVNLQNAYISAVGTLTVTVDGDTPVAKQMVMGTTDNEVARFKLAANASEDITVTDLTLSAAVSSAATGTFKNMKLFMDGVQVGQTVNFNATPTTTNANADFTGLSLTVPKNGNKTLVVKADVSTSDEGATSAGTATFKLLVNKGSGATSITAKGASSGTALTLAADTLILGQATDTDQSANAMTAYRTKITVAYASDSPSGASVGQEAPVVMKINITNTANVGNYPATIESLNFAISQTGVSKAAATARELKVYKESVSSGNLVGTTSFAAANNHNLSDSGFTDAGFTNVEIAPGATKTFFVTLDTRDAGADDAISIGLSETDVSWTDGSTTGITSVPDSLPLASKTLTY